MSDKLEVLAWSLKHPDGNLYQIMVVEQFIVIGRKRFVVYDFVSTERARDRAVMLTQREENYGFELDLEPRVWFLQRPDGTLESWLDARSQVSLTRMWQRAVANGLLLSRGVPR